MMDYVDLNCFFFNIQMNNKVQQLEVNSAQAIKKFVVQIGFQFF